MKQEKTNLYVDMDNVIADFSGEPNAVERYAKEKDFFKILKPMNKWAFEQLLLNDNFNVYIISISPNKQADQDKKAWLHYYYPQIKNDHIIILRTGENKADHMKTKKGILLDDYGKNCELWREKGNQAVKITKPLQEHFNEFMIMQFLDY